MSKREEIRKGLAEMCADEDEVFDEYAIADGILNYLHSQGVVILEERVQRYSEQTGQPIEATPYKILTSLIEEKI